MAEPRNNLDKNQKLALIGLTFFGILLIGIWIFDLNMQIKGPFKISTADNTASTASQTADDKLKTQDTDGDGLLDWDELNIYRSSPYIADTDSDGISDGTEVKNGTDPNCPQGKDCSAANLILTPPVSTSTAISASSGSGEATDADSMDALSSALLAGQVDAATLRQILISSGQVTQSDLDKISDADLLKAYQDQLASSSTQ